MPAAAASVRAEPRFAVVEATRDHCMAVGAAINAHDRAAMVHDHGEGVHPGEALDNRRLIEGGMLAGLRDGEPVAVFGCRKGDGYWSPWVVTTADAWDRPLALLRAFRGVLMTWRLTRPDLRGWVWAESSAVRWLPAIGAAIGPAHPLRCANGETALYHPFHL